MEPKPHSYLLTERERLYFARLRAQFETSVTAGIALICTQQALDGPWRMQADGTGLERADQPEFERLLREMNAVA